MIPIIETGLSIIDKIIPDPKQREEARLNLVKAFQSGDLKEIENAMKVITSEASSTHFITAAWRPITMLTFVAIIANNYIIYPYLSLFWADAPALDLPPDMWQLLKIGIGGYIGGRSVEKTANALKDIIKR